MTIIPESQLFDQRTMHVLIEHDATVQRYRALFALLDWRVVPEPSPDPSRPGKRPHPPSAYIKALLIKLTEGYQYCTQLRRFLIEHPLLVLELGFRPVLNVELPYGFDVERTVPSARCFTQQQRTLDHCLLKDLFAATVQALLEEIPGMPRDRGLRREAHLRLGARKQPARAHQGSLLQGPPAQGRPRLPAGASRPAPIKSSPTARGIEVKEYRLPLWLRHCCRHHCRLR